MECYLSPPSPPSSTPSFLVNFLAVLLGLSYALVGAFSGAITGAIIGPKHHIGMCSGAMIGALSGALSSFDEVSECFHHLQLSDGKGIHCLLSLIYVLGDTVTGRLVRDQVGSTIINAVLSQIRNEESSFETRKGLVLDRVENIPKIETTIKDIVDSWGQSIPCSICLQDFEIGQIVCTLRYCHHMFHQKCIDQWLIKSGSCPLCRKSVEFGYMHTLFW